VEEEEEENDDDDDDDDDESSSVWNGEGDATASLGSAGAEDGPSVDEDAYLMARFGRNDMRDIGGAARRGTRGGQQRRP
jgi:hypothetical protein